MSSFSINESLFVLDLDDDAPSILPVGEVLPDGIKIGVDRDRGEQFAPSCLSRALGERRLSGKAYAPDPPQ